MPVRHTVRSGDCISSIAYAAGFAPDTVWNAAVNDELRALRGNPNTLCAGDVVTVPDRRRKELDRPTDGRHVFRRRGVPEALRFRFLLGGEPRGDEAYRLEVDGVLVSGVTRTDAEGCAEHVISPDAQVARFHFEGDDDDYVFTLGGLEPVSTVRGLQGRLTSLGLYGGAIDGQPSEALSLAIAAFQETRDLTVTGEADAATRARLADEHGV